MAQQRGGFQRLREECGISLPDLFEIRLRRWERTGREIARNGTADERIVWAECVPELGHVVHCLPRPISRQINRGISGDNTASQELRRRFGDTISRN
ncbi:MAG: hypothetical protein NTY25_14720 [Planctomycetia bacterium]|nr:hypothetical protein [Planctomycetia bacterium]